MINILLTAGIDYTAVSQTIRFSAGQSEVNISIPIKDDDITVEPNVTFTVTIIPPKNVILLSGNPIVTIVDDDLSKLRFFHTVTCILIYF